MSKLSDNYYLTDLDIRYDFTPIHTALCKFCGNLVERRNNYVVAVCFECLLTRKRLHQRLYSKKHRVRAKCYMCGVYFTATRKGKRYCLKHRGVKGARSYYKDGILK
jgi:hypothetical protein